MSKSFYVASTDRTVRNIVPVMPGGDMVKFYSCSGSRIEFSFWSRPQLSKGCKNFRLRDKYLSFWSLTQPDSCLVQIGNNQQVKQSQTAAVHGSSPRPGLVWDLQLTAVNSLGFFLCMVKQFPSILESSLTPQCSSSRRAHGDGLPRKQPFVFTVHCLFSQRIIFKHPVTHC